MLSLYHRKGGSARRISKKLFTGTSSVAKLVAVPLFHDVSDREAIIHATVEVDSLVTIHDTDSTQLGVIVKGGSPCRDDKMTLIDVDAFHFVFVARSLTAQGWHRTIQGAMISSER